MDNLMIGERTNIVAKQFRILPARVAQLRREYHDDWKRFDGENEELARV